MVPMAPHSWDIEIAPPFSDLEGLRIPISQEYGFATAATSYTAKSLQSDSVQPHVDGSPLGSSV